MGDGFDVDPEAIRDLAFEVRDGVEPLVQAGGGVPEADAGLMTLVIEKAIASLLDGLTALASKSGDLATGMLSSALSYHLSDQEAQAELAMVLMPGTTPEQAQQMVDDAPGSTWDQLEQEQTAKWREFYDVDSLQEGTPAPEPGLEPGDGLEELLTAPLQLPADEAEER